MIDPFLELTDDAVKLPDQPSPNNEGENAGGQSESLLADVRDCRSLALTCIANAVV